MPSIHASMKRSFLNSRFRSSCVCPLQGVSDADELGTAGTEPLQGCLLSLGHHQLGLVAKGGIMDIQALGHSALGGIADYKLEVLLREADIYVIDFVLLAGRIG